MWPEVARLRDDLRDGPVPLGLWAIADDATFAAWRAHQHVTEQFAGHLLRDIFRNPFRSITRSPTWRSETVVAIATGIYADRAFDRMPVLADALEEAGCDHADILSHCRDTSLTHVRGCWVVDLVLGKG